MEYITKGHINSLNGNLAEITILEKKEGNNYIVKYNEIKCYAIFNCFTNSFYVDDIYGIIKE